MNRASLLLATSVAVLSAVFVSGCLTRGMRVQATVTAAPPPCPTSAAVPPGAPQPLGGAEVSMSCPQVIKAEGLSLLGQTDAQGALDFEEHPLGRWIHDNCELVVQKSGFHEARFPVAEVCKEYSANHCMHSVIRAELTRAAPPAAPCP